MYRFALSFERNIRGKDPNNNLDERRVRAEILAKAGCNLFWDECVTAIEHQRGGGQSIRIFLLINKLAIFLDTHNWFLNVAAITVKENRMIPPGILSTSFRRIALHAHRPSLPFGAKEKQRPL
jgi:hypothetical protein